ncbi:hypothetical protein BDV12DRAFT_190107 [Aspergillus spectabilis]
MTLAIEWPDDLYARRGIMGADCPNKLHDMTIAVGPETFSFKRSGSVPFASSMKCTLIQQGPIDGTRTTVYGEDEIHTVSMAVVESGAKNTVLLTQCGDDPWCCPTTATICTTATSSHEACESVHNEEFPDLLSPITRPWGLLLALPTHLLVGGLAGLGLAFLLRLRDE